MHSISAVCHLVIYDLTSAPRANDKVWYQPHRVSNGIWQSPAPQKQNTLATKNNSSVKMFKFKYSKAMNTTCHSDRRTAMTSVTVLHRRVSTWWLWKVHQYKIQLEFSEWNAAFFYFFHSVHGLEEATMFVNTVSKHFILTCFWNKRPIP